MADELSSQEVHELIRHLSKATAELENLQERLREHDTRVLRLEQELSNYRQVQATRLAKIEQFVDECIGGRKALLIVLGAIGTLVAIGATLHKSIFGGVP